MRLEELLKEHFKDGLTEEAQTEITTLFEAKVNETVAKKVEEIEESVKADLLEKNKTDLAEFKENLTENLNDYLEYTVDEFVKDNQVAVESDTKVSMADTLIKKLVGTLKENQINIDEKDIDVVKSLEEKNTEITEEKDNAVVENIKLKKDILEYQKAVRFNKLTENLTTNDREKVLSLIEGLDASTIDIFTDKVNLVIESFIKKAKENKEDELNKEDLDENLNKDSNGLDKYLPQTVYNA